MAYNINGGKEHVDPRVILNNWEFEFVQHSGLKDRSLDVGTRFIPDIDRMKVETLDLMFVEDENGGGLTVKPLLNSHLTGRLIETNIEGIRFDSLISTVGRELMLSKLFVIFEQQNPPYSKRPDDEDIVRAYYNTLVRIGDYKVAVGSPCREEPTTGKLFERIKREGAWVGRLDKARKEYKF